MGKLISGGQQLCFPQNSFCISMSLLIHCQVSKEVVVVGGGVQSVRLTHSFTEQFIYEIAAHKVAEQSFHSTIHWVLLFK